MLECLLADGFTNIRKGEHQNPHKGDPMWWRVQCCRVSPLIWSNPPDNASHGEHVGDHNLSVIRVCNSWEGSRSTYHSWGNRIHQREDHERSSGTGVFESYNRVSAGNHSSRAHEYTLSSEEEVPGFPLDKLVHVET
jgi:hypothetical protein